MKIFYIVNARIPTEKAHGYQIMKMCESFSRVGAEVHLVLPGRKNIIEDSSFFFYGISPIFKIHKLPIIDFINLNPFLKAPFSIFPHIVSIATFLWQADDFLKKNFQNGDIIYTRDMEVSWLFRNYPKLFFEVHQISRILKFWAGPWKSPARLISVTNSMKAILVGCGIPAEKIFVAPDAVSLEDFNLVPDKISCRHKLSLSTDKNIVGYIGRFVTMGKEKGIACLIRAFGILFKNNSLKDPMLLCVGGPLEMVPYYLNLADREGLPREVIKFVDLVPNRDVPLWVNACDVVAMPFPWERHYAFEASPLKMFEYMAAKKPIISTKLPAVMEILNINNSALVDLNNDQELARNIKALLEDKELADRLANQARIDVERYTWLNRAKDIMNLISSC